jgi:hypothetical protein
MEMTRISIIKSSLACLVLVLLITAGCQARDNPSTPTTEILFVPPTANQDLDTVSPIPIIQPTRQTDCLNQLKFKADLTIPDGTEVSPGEKISKRWLIVNGGGCNWDQSYSIQLISGLALGAETVQHLYPARQNSEVVIEIVFTAPDNPGRYNTWWQAYDPDGNRFGDPVFMEISVINDE